MGSEFTVRQRAAEFVRERERAAESGRVWHKAAESGRDNTSCFILYSFDEISFDNDLALLHLNESVDWGDNIRPICLPDSEDENHQGIK